MVHEDECAFCARVDTEPLTVPFFAGSLRAPFSQNGIPSIRQSSVRRLPSVWGCSSRNTRSRSGVSCGSLHLRLLVVSTEGPKQPRLADSMKAKRIAGLRRRRHAPFITSEDCFCSTVGLVSSRSRPAWLHHDDNTFPLAVC